MNLQKMMKQAQQMQQKMEAAQNSLSDLQVEGSAGGDMVKATMSGKRELLSVSIDPKVVDPDDVDMLEDLIVAAINDAGKKAEDESARVMGDITAGMPLPPGMKLPF